MTIAKLKLHPIINTFSGYFYFELQTSLLVFNKNVKNRLEMAF
jgi:hypothetical protein